MGVPEVPDRRAGLLLIRGILVATSLLGGLAACGGDEESAQAVPAPAPKDDRTPIDPATAGTLQGVISFEGTPPPPKEISFSGEPGCDVHEGPVYFNTLLVNGGKLQNAFVWVKEGLEGYRALPPADEVVLDQRGCIYSPRVVGVQVGQPLTFVNSDPVSHNVHTVPKKNRSANISMAKKGMRSTRTFSKTEVMMKTKCDVHPWMGAWIGVVPHAGFDVSGEDGAFEISNLPPGDYLVEAWHEKLGSQEMRVTVASSAATVANFTLK